MWRYCNFGWKNWRISSLYHRFTKKDCLIWRIEWKVQEWLFIYEEISAIVNHEKQRYCNKHSIGRNFVECKSQSSKGGPPLIGSAEWRKYIARKNQHSAWRWSRGLQKTSWKPRSFKQLACQEHASDFRIRWTGQRPHW